MYSWSTCPINHHSYCCHYSRIPGVVNNRWPNNTLLQAGGVPTNVSIHKPFTNFQDMFFCLFCFFKFKDQFDRLLTYWNYNVPHLTHEHHSLYSSRVRVVPFDDYNLHAITNGQSKEAIQLVSQSWNHWLNYQSDRRSQNAQTFKDLSGIIRFSQTCKALKMADHSTFKDSRNSSCVWVSLLAVPLCWNTWMTQDKCIKKRSGLRVIRVVWLTRLHPKWSPVSSCRMVGIHFVMVGSFGKVRCGLSCRVLLW